MHHLNAVSPFIFNPDLSTQTQLALKKVAQTEDTGDLLAQCQQRGFNFQAEPFMKTDSGEDQFIRLTPVSVNGLPLDKNMVVIDAENIPGDVHHVATRMLESGLRIIPVMKRSEPTDAVQLTII